MTALTGTLDRITFHNEQNGFTVARIVEKDSLRLITIVGTLASINPGESISINGTWSFDKKFGEQFKIESYEVIPPASLLDIKRYLGSGLIKGIGPKMAERIVEKFGMDALTIIENNPQRLTEIGGFGRKRIEMIIGAWEEQKGVKDIMIFLQGVGISSAYAVKIYKHYGRDAIRIVRDNPYQLAADVHGIGFLKADRIAMSIGIDPQSEKRAKAGVLYTLNKCTEEGHVYYPYELLVRTTTETLSIERTIVVFVLDELIAAKALVAATINECRVIFPSALFAAEQGCALLLQTLFKVPSTIRPIDPAKALTWVQEELAISLADRQQEAVALALQNKTLVITGGPGTGKTTIIRAIIKLYERLQVRVVLGAPTGRAAKRMEESTGHGAKTIHRLLEFNFHRGGFVRNQNNPLEADVVIIDEASMIDIVLAHQLLKAIPAAARLILVGDICQLPSVGPGSVLGDIIASNQIPVVRLDRIFRQAQASMIVTNAHRINNGEFPAIPEADAPSDSDFFFITEENPGDILDKIVTLCRERIPRRYGLDPTRDIQVLSPMHRGIIGVQNINDRLQQELNVETLSVRFGSATYRVGDKIMQTTNNYDKEVFNGDIGWIKRINEDENWVEIDFEGRAVVYQNSELYEIMLAYAISVHKSQGSEYAAVIIPVATQHYIMLQRNLIYTALTRAKKLAILIGTHKALAIAINNNTVEQRYTNLATTLRHQNHIR